MVCLIKNRICIHKHITRCFTVLIHIEWTFSRNGAGNYGKVCCVYYFRMIGFIFIFQMVYHIHILGKSALIYVWFLCSKRGRNRILLCKINLHGYWEIIWMYIQFWKNCCIAFSGHLMLMHLTPTMLYFVLIGISGMRNNIGCAVLWSVMVWRLLFGHVGLALKGWLWRWKIVYEVIGSDLFYFIL
jgi:hypothetical protein